MPPKKVPNKSCTGRDLTPLQAYVLNSKLSRGFLAHMLEQDGFLDKFRAQPDVNECQFSFENSNWFAIYINDENGNKVFFNKNGEPQPGILYFHVKEVNGEYGIDPSSYTFEKPPELENLRHCVINDKGKCGVPEKQKEPKASKAPKEPKAPKASKASKSVVSEAGPSEVVRVPDTVTEAAVQALQLGLPPEQVTLKNKISREEAEKMDKKAIIEWMSKNMYASDIAACLRTGSLSKADRKKLDDVETDAVAGISPADIAAIQATGEVQSEEIKNVFKQMTKEDIKKTVNSSSNKTEAVLKLCERFHYEGRVSKKSGKLSIFDANEDPVSVDEALEQCAELESRRLRNIMLNIKTKVLARRPVPKQPKEPEAPQESIVDQLKRLSLDDKLDRVKQICESKEYTVRKNKTGTQLVVLDAEGDPVSWEEAVQSCTSFGIRRKVCKPVNSKKPIKVSTVRSKFKCAAKKCKKSKDYRKCMKTSLRKIYNR